MYTDSIYAINTPNGCRFGHDLHVGGVLRADAHVVLSNSMAEISVDRVHGVE